MAVLQIIIDCIMHQLCNVMCSLIFYLEKIVHGKGRHYGSINLIKFFLNCKLVIFIYYELAKNKKTKKKKKPSNKGNKMFCYKVDDFTLSFGY